MSRMLSRRALLRATVIGAGGLAAAACQPKTVEVEKVITQSVKETVVVEKAVTEAPKGVVELVWSSWGSPGYWQPKFDIFTSSQPHIRVIEQPYPYDQYREKLLSLFASGNPPDVLQGDGYWMYEFMSRGMALALTEYLADDPIGALDKYLPGAFCNKMHTLKGVIYGLPNGDGPRVFWFNPDAFEQAGLKTPLQYVADGEWNWNTFVTVCQALSGGEGSDRRYAFYTWMGRQDTDPIMRSFGGGWTNQEADEVWTGRPGSAEGLQMVLDVHLKHKAAPLASATEALGGTTQMFLTGRLAMFYSGVWEVISLKNTGIKYDVAPVPAGPEGSKTLKLMNAYLITSGTKHPYESWQLLRYMKSPAMERERVQGNGVMPFFKENVELFVEKGMVPNNRLFVDLLQDANRCYEMPTNLHSYEMDDVIGSTLGSALSENKDAKWALAEAEPKLAALVKG
ncbi:MAG: sugar ABC transporter substrate-binding protein [Anaerolineae bacterium]|nr:sugar ABC transporter substrate-binding protein [Anaerolineae bacterium]